MSAPPIDINSSEAKAIIQGQVDGSSNLYGGQLYGQSTVTPGLDSNAQANGISATANNTTTVNGTSTSVGADPNGQSLVQTVADGVKSGVDGVANGADAVLGGLKKGM